MGSGPRGTSSSGIRRTRAPRRAQRRAVATPHRFGRRHEAPNSTAPAPERRHARTRGRAAGPPCGRRASGPPSGLCQQGSERSHRRQNTLVTRAPPQPARTNSEPQARRSHRAQGRTPRDRPGRYDTRQRRTARSHPRQGTLSRTSHPTRPHVPRTTGAHVTSKTDIAHPGARHAASARGSKGHKEVTSTSTALSRARHPARTHEQRASVARTSRRTRRRLVPPHQAASARGSGGQQEVTHASTPL